MKEKDLQRAFGKFLTEEGFHYFDRTSVFELKIEKTHRFSFGKLKEHQKVGLKKATQGLYHKISDSPIFEGQKTRFTKPKPFDCIYLRHALAFVVIMFYKPRKHKVIFLFSIGMWKEIEKVTEKKSVTEEELVGFTRNGFHGCSMIDITKYFQPNKKATT